MAAAKEATQFANNYKETKKCRANETYQLLAQSVTFITHMPTLLILIK